MQGLYTIISEMSIVGIRIVDIILAFVFDAIAFPIAWKVGGLGGSPKTRQILHWSTRIVLLVAFIFLSKGIYAIVLNLR